MSPVAHFVVLAAVYLVSPGEKRCVTSLKTAARESVSAREFHQLMKDQTVFIFIFLFHLIFLVTSLQSVNLIREKITT